MSLMSLVPCVAVLTRIGPSRWSAADVSGARPRARKAASAATARRAPTARFRPEILVMTVASVAKGVLSAGTACRPGPGGRWGTGPGLSPAPPLPVSAPIDLCPTPMPLAVPAAPLVERPEEEQGRLGDGPEG